LYTTLLADATLYEALLAIDLDLAETAQAGGCLICGGRLHHADFPRKPRGGPASLGAEYDRRLSFCCAACRKRLTPMSVRFLGRRVYLGVVVLLAGVLRQGPTPWRVTQLRDALGVSVDTLRRWHRWWREAFVHTAFWKAAQARLVPAVEPTTLPRGLVERFAGGACMQIVATLRFLGPLTTRSAVALTAGRGRSAEVAS
jgi:hypothetical protein